MKPGFGEPGGVIWRPGGGGGGSPDPPSGVEAAVTAPKGLSAGSEGSASILPHRPR